MALPKPSLRKAEGGGPLITPCTVCGAPSIIEVVYARSDELAVAYCEKHQGDLRDFLAKHKGTCPDDTCPHCGSDKLEPVGGPYYSELTE